PVAAGELHFEPVARERFPAFDLGVAAGVSGRGAPVVYNAANEVAVAAFLNERIPFTAIAAAIGDALDRWAGREMGSVEAVFEADGWARRTAQTFIDGHGRC